MWKVKRQKNDDDRQVFHLTVEYSLLPTMQQQFSFLLLPSEAPKRKHRSLKGSVTRDFIFIKLPSFE